MSNVLGLAGWLGISFGAAVVGSRFMPGEWYASLNKPAWNPPSWIFAPVWSVLYVLMGIAAWLVWRKAGFAGARLALAAFFVQLVLNALWSPLFFGWQRPDLALVDIVALWLAILATILLFRRVHRTAAALLVPYLAWVSFATVLNATLWTMNRA